MKPNNESLERLLRSLRDDPHAIPSESFRTNARIRILNRIRIGHTPEQSPSWIRRTWQATLATLAMPALLGVGVVVAAQSSNPHDTLYPVKIASEKAALMLAPAPQIKTDVATTIIDRRAQEIKHAQGDTQEIQERIQTYKETVHTMQKTQDIEEKEVNKHIEEHATLMKDVEPTPSPTPEVKSTQEPSDDHESSSSHD